MGNSVISLNDLPVGEKARVQALALDGLQRRRIMDLGLVDGTVVEALYRSPGEDPTAYYFRGTVIALRSEDTKKILIDYIDY